MFSLRSKLILGFTALLAVTIIVGAIGVSVVNSYSQALTKILRENYDSIVYCEGMQRALAEYRAGAFDFAVRGRHSQNGSIEAAQRDFVAYLEKESGNITLPTEADSVKKVARIWAELQTVIADLSSTDQTDSARLVQFQLHTQLLFESLRATIQNISDLNLSNMVSVDGQAQSRAQEAKRITYALIVAGTLLALLLIIITGRSILQPLGMLTQSIREVQRGNLNLVVESKYRDEVGRLIEAFNDMAAELRVLKLGDQAKLARSQQSAQIVLDNLPDAVVVTAPDATVEMANAAARKLMGVVPGGSIYDTSQEWHRSLKSGHQPESADKDKHDRLIQVFVNGQEKFYLPRVLPIKDEAGLPVGLILAFLDVTRMRRITELENDLVATVSHELKTPLTSVRMALHMLTDERVGSLNDRQTELLLAAKDDSERLSSIINDLLDVARYRAGQTALELSPVMPAKLVSDASVLAASTFVKAGVALHVNIPDKVSDVLANESRIALVLSNMLSNALKHSVPGGEVLISILDQEDVVEFSVADKGTGIAADELPHVFDRFFRGKQETELSGAGLGLAIAKEIVEAHGGKIGVTSVLGQGATFTFTLRKATELA
jgi:NtrC-family two-component system sensor histidine kinase KinB